MVDKQEQETIAGVLNSRMSRQLLYYLDVCTRCSICKDACHQYVKTKDVLYLPAYRAELIRRIYKKYLTRTGRIVPALNEAREIDDRWLDELYRTTYACTGCRRCMYYCPFSIDTTWILAVAKAILIAAGRGSQILTEVADASISKGENIELFKDVIIDMLKDTEKELQEKVGDPKAAIPIDKEGADILYVALAGTHSILPAAIIFHEARVDWTLSLFEASNYGYFLGDVDKAIAIAKRIVDEARRLKVKEVVITECGHAYRVMQYLYEIWAKKKHPFQVSSIIEVLAHYVEEGRIHLNRGQIKEPLTYHDPCQVGRNAGFYEEPRYIIRQVAADFRELTPNREKNWCCGGGGGLVAEPDLDDFRAKTGEVKVEQIRNTGAKIVVSPCENCRLQLGTLNEKYNMDIRITSMMDLVVDTMQISAAEPKATKPKKKGKK
ncbi:(Fe-S)-binding protein [Chloroflexota bacterium]